MSTQPPPPASGLPVSPCRAEELADWLGEQAEIAKRLRMPIATSMLSDTATLLRSHQAELLALQADRRRLDWLEAKCEVTVSDNEEGNLVFARNSYLNPAAMPIRVLIDAALHPASPHINSNEK